MYLCYIWGLVVLALLCYICVKLNEVQRLLHIALLPEETKQEGAISPENVAARLRSSIPAVLANLASRGDSATAGHEL